MSLSPSVPRQPKHCRQITCQGYLREDGLWDIEAHLLDTRQYALTFYDGRTLAPDQPLHEMQLRITINHDFIIQAAEAVTLNGPHPTCPEISQAYSQLQGLQIGPGFNQKIRQLFRGVQGCTHLTELMGTIATVAFQTVTQPTPNDGTPGRNLAALVDSCHGWRSDSEAVRVKVPERYTGLGKAR